MIAVVAELQGDRVLLRPLEPADVERIVKIGAEPEVARWLIDERGHHRLTIDPALANDPAIRAYEAVGFKRVGVLRRYWRDPEGVWQDGLLLDLLADEL